MKLRKYIFTLALAVILILPISTGTFAADTNGINVLYNGNKISFSDVTPISQNGRTYVPFRALFEAMGATVDYNDATKTVTATLDGTTVNFVIGQKTMNITTGGNTVTEQIDATPFIKNSRTLIPARFAAQALGFNVGWDQNSNTVLILDTNSLLEKGNYKFTLMDKLLDYSRQLSQEPLALSGSFNISMNIKGDPNDTEITSDIPITMKGTIDGITSEKVTNMDIAMAMDISSILNNSSTDLSSAVILQAYNQQLKNVKVEYIVNLETGKLYMRSPLFSLFYGVATDAWLSYDMNDMLSESGTNISLNSLLDMSTNKISFDEYFPTILNMAPITNKDDYDDMISMVNMVGSAFSDQSFAKSGNDYKTAYTDNQDGDSFALNMTISTENDKVTGYNLNIKAGTQQSDSFNLTCSMDNNNMTFNLNSSFLDSMDMEMDFDIKYSNTTKIPDIAPPAGSTIISFEQYLENQN